MGIGIVVRNATVWNQENDDDDNNNNNDENRIYIAPIDDAIWLQKGCNLL